MTRTNKSLAIVAGVALVLGLAACSSTAPSAKSTADDVAAKYGLPANTTTFNVGTSVGTAPYEFYESGSNKISGYEPDLLTEVAKRLGVQINWSPTDFGAMFSALNAKRTDFIANGIIDRKSRQADFDMLDYIKDASAFLGRTGTTATLTSMEAVCGHSLAVPSGTTWETYFDQQSAACVSKGKPKIQMTLVKDPTAATLAVTSGRAEYAVNQQPLLAYAAKQTPGLEVSKLTYLGGVVALTFPKNSPLIKPVQKVIDEMMSDGTYDKILKKWGLDGLALKPTSMNAGTAE